MNRVIAAWTIFILHRKTTGNRFFGINENKQAASTSYSYLLARVLSIQKYQRYVSKKLNGETSGNR